jgi:hypothetical protein
VVSIHRSSSNIEPLIFYFSNLKRTYSLSRENRFQQLKPKYVAYQNMYMGLLLQRTGSGESPFVFMADKFPTFTAENRFYNCSGNRLPAIG